jgi:hypothetical protein
LVGYSLGQDGQHLLLHGAANASLLQRLRCERPTMPLLAHSCGPVRTLSGKGWINGHVSDGVDRTYDPFSARAVRLLLNQPQVSHRKGERWSRDEGDTGIVKRGKERWKVDHHSGSAVPEAVLGVVVTGELAKVAYRARLVHDQTLSRRSHAQSRG